MAKSKQQTIQSLKTKKQKREMSHLHFAMTSKNYIIIGIGIAIIIIGYLLMSENSVDGFLPTVVAPILLIFGYCVVVPVGILYTDKGVNQNVVEEIKEVKSEVKTNVAAKSSNIKTA
ncbi:MAG: hypothetical protein IPL53_08000 [Ignavibacteria bacterium]|nr:hypothetical protein [Ignavibacteria bacterium]